MIDQYKPARIEEDEDWADVRLLKQETFAMEYVKCNFKPDVAASKAGISLQTARNWLKEPMVASYICELIERRRMRLQMSMDKELVKMSAIVDLAIGKEDYKAAVAGQKAVLAAVDDRDAGNASKGPMIQLVFGSGGGSNGGNDALPQPAYDVEGLPDMLGASSEVSGCTDSEE